MNSKSIALAAVIIAALALVYYSYPEWYDAGYDAGTAPTGYDAGKAYTYEPNGDVPLKK